MSGEYGVLSMVDDQGQAYGVPLNYFSTGKRIYFHCALDGQKIDNLLLNDKVSFCVVGRTKVLPAQFSTEYESVIASGVASVVQGPERYQALTGLLEKYSAGHVAEGLEYIGKLDSQTKVVRIDVDSMTGKAKQEA
jgi:nitroimidazol reductase NimA-like FMN-containing flavoprotein (pyridoxamine 5'-phosphate oxidase superfamily)